MRGLDAFYQMSWPEIGWSAFGLLLLVGICWAFIKRDEANREYNEWYNTVNHKEEQPKADIKRYNTFLDSIESDSPCIVTLDEYKKAKELVWKYEKQESC